MAAKFKLRLESDGLTVKHKLLAFVEIFKDNTHAEQSSWQKSEQRALAKDGAG
jgi:hypothetical protein